MSLIFELHVNAFQIYSIILVFDAFISLKVEDFFENDIAYSAHAFYLSVSLCYNIDCVCADPK